MTPSKRGDVVLVPFPFSDLTAVKRRPALVVSTEAYNGATGDAIIAQITSMVKSPARPGDYILARWRDAGLPLSSLVRAKLTTLHSSLFIRTLGSMPADEMAHVDAGIAGVLGLEP
ncbi:MAG TPA: type II toxin-antitoxin system PemK/MazF family toxin [Dehalococcoidia bacterium]|nr:type II toxin-antitoxin system PemK/MazF family toxin [Dehalococcoidia bacterium]